MLWKSRLSAFIIWDKPIGDGAIGLEIGNRCAVLRPMSPSPMNSHYWEQAMPQALSEDLPPALSWGRSQGCPPFRSHGSVASSSRWGASHRFANTYSLTRSICWDLLVRRYRRAAFLSISVNSPMSPSARESTWYGTNELTAVLLTPVWVLFRFWEAPDTVGASSYLRSIGNR